MMLIASLIPISASATETTESTDGASLEELEKFGFSLDPDSYDTNALKPGTHPLEPKYDLYIDNGSKHSKTDAWLKNSKTLLSPIYYYFGLSKEISDAFSNKESVPYFVSTGFAATETGVDDHIAKVYFESGKTGGKILLSIYDAKGNALLTGYETGGYVYESEIEMWEVEGLLSVTSGDFDGDGVDEIAVYTPNNSAAKNAKACQIYMGIFEFDAASKSITSKKYIDLATDVSSWTQGHFTLPGFNVHGPIFYYLPYVALCGDDLSGDGIDDLSAVASFSTWARNRTGSTTNSIKQLIDPSTRLASVLEVYEGKEGGGFTWSVKHRTMVTTGLTGGSSDSSTQNRFILRNANITTGDVNGDGINEIIIAGNYTRASNYSTTSTNTATSNSFVEVDGEHALCHIVGYTTYENLKNREMYNSNSEYNWTVQRTGDGQTYWYNEDETDSGPITVSLASFKRNGTGYPETIFVGGQFFEYNSESGTLAFLENSDISYPESIGSTSVVWIGKAVAGNLANDMFGREVLAFPFYMKRSGEEIYTCEVDFFYNKTTSRYLGGNEALANTYHYALSEVSSQKLISLALIDSGNKTGYLTYNGNNTDVYYSDVEVLSIMQAPPLYEELNDDTYIGNSETSFTKSEGSSEEWTHGGSLTAGVVAGFEQETSFLGLFKVAGAEYEVSITGTVGGEDAKEKSYDYSSGFATAGTTDTAVIFAVPYVRYNCTMYVPEYKLPTEADYQELCKFRDELAANLSKYVETGDTQSSGDYKKGCKYYYYRYSSYVNENNAEEQQAVLYNVAEEIDFIEKAIAACGKGGTGQWGGTVEGAVLPYHYCIPQQPMVTTIDVKTYDAIADATPGLEKIYGNVFSETYRAGDPNTYAHSTGALNATGTVLQSKMSTGGSSDGYMTNSNSSSGSSQSQSISVEESDSDTLTWGAAVENTSLANVGGVNIGFTVSAEYNGSHTTTTTTGNEYSGTVVALPANTPADYAYSWKLVSYTTMLNGKKVPVVGYLTKITAVAPPSVAQNISVENLTDTSATLTWENGERAADYYKISRVDADGNNPVPIANNIVPVDGKCSYDISNLQPSGVTPSTSYYVIESYNTSGKKSIASEIISVTTMPEGFAVAMSVEGIENVIYRDGKNLSASLYIDGNQGYDTFYQWQVSDDNEWVDLDGQSSKTMDFKISTLDNNKKVRCAVTMFIGSRSYKIYSAPVTLRCANSYANHKVEWKDDAVNVTFDESSAPATVILKIEDANGTTFMQNPNEATDCTFDLSGVQSENSKVKLFIWDKNLRPLGYPFVR